MQPTRNSMFLPQNAFDEVSIDGLLFRRPAPYSEERVPLPASLKRAVIPNDLVHAFPHPSIVPFISTRPPEDFEPNGPVPRPSSQLPPAGHSELSLCLGSVLGAGRSGVVCEAHITQLKASDSGPESQPMGNLPPLVVKIGRRNRCQSITREAWFYEEMECLQGVAIARCYGCFEMELGKGQRVAPLVDHPTYDASYDHIPEFDEYPYKATKEAGISPHPFAHKLIFARNRLFVLILERLGDPISIGTTISQADQDDMMGVIENLASLGVSLNFDIRPDNILAAPHDIPGMISPYTKRSHAWRVIDFELAKKSAYTRDIILKNDRPWLRHVFYTVPLFRPPTPPTSEPGSDHSSTS